MTDHISDNLEVWQGHTARYDKKGDLWILTCITCGWKSEGNDFAEIRFDFRYHGLKTSINKDKIDWDKLL